MRGGERRDGCPWSISRWSAIEASWSGPRSASGRSPFFSGTTALAKSSLLRVIPLLRDTLRDGHTLLDLNSPSVRGAFFRDLLCKIDFKSHMSVELGTGEAKARYLLKDLYPRHIQVLEKVSLTRGERTETIEWTTEGRSYDLRGTEDPGEPFELTSQGLSLHGRRPDGTELDWPVPGELELRQAQWIDAVRWRPRRRILRGLRPREPPLSRWQRCPGRSRVCSG